jgi:hypothetical protein
MTFTTLHIVLTAALTGVVALIVGMWRLPRKRWLDIIAAAVLAAAAVLLWRLSANMPQLNDDGLPGFSANDWAARRSMTAATASSGSWRPWAPSPSTSSPFDNEVDAS